MANTTENSGTSLPPSTEFDDDDKSTITLEADLNNVRLENNDSQKDDIVLLNGEPKEVNTDLNNKKNVNAELLLEAESKDKKIESNENEVETIAKMTVKENEMIVLIQLKDQQLASSQNENQKLKEELAKLRDTDQQFPFFLFPLSLLEPFFANEDSSTHTNIDFHPTMELICRHCGILCSCENIMLLHNCEPDDGYVPHPEGLLQNDDDDGTDKSVIKYYMYDKDYDYKWTCPCSPGGCGSPPFKTESELLLHIMGKVNRHGCVFFARRFAYWLTYKKKYDKKEAKHHPTFQFDTRKEYSTIAVAEDDQDDQNDG